MKTIGKVLTLFVLALFALFFAGVGHAVYQWSSRPVPQPTIEELERAARMAQFRELFWYGAGAVVLLALLSATVQWLVVPAWRRWRLIFPDTTGAFPLVPMVYEAFDELGHKVRYRAWFDPNMGDSPVTQFVENGSQQVRTHYGESTDASRTIATQFIGSWQGQRAQHGMQGRGGGRRGPTVAEMKARSGVYDEEARRAAARRRGEEARADIAQQRLLGMGADEADVVIDWQPVDIRTAMRTATPTQLVVGQCQQTGEIIHWDVKGGHPHARLHGETQSGKTTMAMLLTGQMVSMGWNVLIADRRNFKDWGIFEGRAQLIDTRDPRVLVEVLDILVRMHKDRDDMVSQAEAGNIDNLPNPPERFGLVIDEFGTQAAIASDAKLLERVNHNLFILAAEAASNGIHILITDQKPMADGWDAKVRANLGMVLVGHMAKGTGISAAGKDVGWMMKKYEFHCSVTDAPVKGWPVADLLRASRRTGHEVKHIEVAQIEEKIERQDEARGQHGGGGKSSPKWNRCMEYLQANPEADAQELMKKCKVSKSLAYNAIRAFSE